MLLSSDRTRRNKQGESDECARAKTKTTTITTKNKKAKLYHTQRQNLEGFKIFLFINPFVQTYDINLHTHIHAHTVSHTLSRGSAQLRHTVRYIRRPLYNMGKMYGKPDVSDTHNIYSFTSTYYIRFCSYKVLYLTVVYIYK